MILLIKNKQYLKYDTDLTIYSYNENINSNVEENSTAFINNEISSTV